MKDTNIKAYYDDFLDQNMDELWTLSKYVHANPELGYQEHKACQIQCNYLEKRKFTVQKGIGGLETAFLATYGKGYPHIAVISEYDALPELGHACGHNLICATALGTAVEVQRYMQDNQTKGTLYVIGTPAEEGGGGKIKLLEKGVFQSIDAVFMMHPTSDKTRLAGACMSSMSFRFNFKGKEAHASSHPEDGINALSAANLYFTATGLLRQHFKGDVRLSGILTEGGSAAGLIPSKACVEGRISSFSLTELQKNVERVKRCAQGSAQAMGCELEVSITEGYQGRVPNKTLSDVCRNELEALHEPLLDGMPSDFGGEDLGNVSRIIPICNPYVTIFGDYKISNHTAQFRELAISKAGYRCIQVGSKGMARTIMEVYENPDLIDQAKAELKERMANEQK